jgi:pimeloyl-ACP methyl ester carboxylesterase
MPFVSNRGQKIHYSKDGSGPLVVHLPGLLMAERWRQSGVIDALSDGFTVACIDSLGEGLSDKPPDSRLYAQRQRAADVVAVIDQLGYDRAHLVGYSMGGWLSVGVAKYHPDRLSALVIGGWDILNGLPRRSNGPLRFDVFIKIARRTSPALVEWITPELEPAVRACFEALDELEGARDAVLNADVPVMIWQGRDDVNHEPMRAFASANQLPFLSAPGAHVTAALRPDAETIRSLRTFLDRKATP